MAVRDKLTPEDLRRERQQTGAGGGSTMTAAATADQTPSPRRGGGIPPGQGPGGQAGGPSGGAYNPAGTDLFGNRQSDPFTGFAERYLPQEAWRLFNDPAIIFQDVMGARGMPLQAGSGFMEGAENIAALLPYFNAIFGQGVEGGFGDEAFINMAAEIYRQMTTPGGRAPDTGYMLEQLQDPQGLLAQALYGTADAPMDVGDQVSQLTDFITASMYGVNPIVQRAVVDAVQGAGRGYRGALTRGDMQTGTNPFVDYVRNQGLIPTGAF